MIFDKRKAILLILFLILLSACSPKISENFEQNRYVRNYSIHVINDSLRLYFKTPADINYATDKKRLKDILEAKEFKIKEKVLVYGRTEDPPYEYFVTISKDKDRIKPYPDQLIVLDTTVSGNTIQFIGNALSTQSKLNLENDLTTIFKSFEMGTGYRKDISTVMDIVYDYENSNKFLVALRELQEFPTYDQQEEWAKFQMELTYSSFLGNNKYYDDYITKLESRYRQNDSIIDILKKHSKTEAEVLNTIIKEAREHKLVMINEDHFYPHHRLLVTALLNQFKDIGYNYLALETLGAQQDSLLNLENAYPTLKTGFYSNEQNFSNLIRKAKELGYYFVGYENTDRDLDRELCQAQNLYNKTFKLNPDAKVL
ncbi:MAG: hypothetical protein R3213_12465, partial [Flavobacteriaceae bacterium]|nr:hypothetical protein [Flavobacteriaceae bacterium]